MFNHVYGYKKPEEDPLSHKYPCDKCEQRFSHKSDLKRHEIAQHFGIEYPCSLCGFHFKREDNLQHHKRMVHYGDFDSKFQCSKCNEKFAKKSHLERHVKVKRNCDVCGETFCTVRQVQEHKRRCHSSFQCFHCKKVCRDNNDLSRHLKDAFKSDGGLKHECDQCDATFCNIKILSKHKKSHGRQPIYCDFCSKTFTTNYNRDAHVAKREEKRCEQCGKIVCSKNDLRDHIIVVHERRKAAI